MPFPEATRVIYGKNPLKEVICQLRFPSILKIDQELPVNFQERVRSAYPLYQKKETTQIPGLPPELAGLFAAEIAGADGRRAHEFRSRDDVWRVSLTRDFISLTCHQYERWEQFQERLTTLTTALSEIYSPAFYTRIGLRYRDVIQRTTLGLGDTPWSQLLHPWIAGPLATTAEESVDDTTHDLLIRLPDSRSRVRIRHGLTVEQNASETRYFIDADLYCDKQTETTDVITTLTFLNRQAGCLFRWCIQDRLHNAMEPRAV